MIKMSSFNKTNDVLIVDERIIWFWL